MPTVTEGNLTFAFPANWIALKYDAEDGFYKRTIDKYFDELKAVDIIATDAAGTQLVLLEVKDFRGHETANRKRITTGKLAVEIGQKALHTLSGLYLGLRLRQPELEPFRLAVLPPPESLVIVLLLAEDLPGTSLIKAQNRTTHRQNLLTKLRTMFKPLGIRAQLYSQYTVPARAGWTVS